MTCNKKFVAGHAARFCPQCAADRRKAQKAAYAERLKNGKVRNIGSIAKCERCGDEYTVDNGHQRYCQDCGKIVRDEQHRQSMADIWETRGDELKEAAKTLRESAVILDVCVICGKSFRNPGTAKTCSPECSAELAKIRIAEKLKDEDYRRLMAERAKKYRKPTDEQTREKNKEYGRRYREKLKKDPERLELRRQKRREYEAKRKADPAYVERYREYWREYNRKRRAKERAEKP